MKKSSVFIIFLIIYLGIFGLYIFSNGMPVGNDWAFPVFGYHLENWVTNNFYLWQDTLGNIFGSRLSFNVSLIFQIVGKYLYNLFNLTGEIYQKCLFIFAFFLGGYSTYLLMYKYSKNTFYSILAGLIFTLNPVTFNFILMGWNLAFISIFAFPLILLLLEKYFDSNDFKYIVLISLVFGLFGFIESQSIIHFPVMLTFYFIVKKGINKSSIKEYLRIMFTIILIPLLLHCFWIISVLLIKDPYIASTIAKVDIDRFALRFSYLNILRGWGSVYNFQYETIYKKVLIIFSFAPFLALFYYLFKKQTHKMFIFYVILFFYPFLIYLFTHHLSSYVPYTAVIRDFGRSFPYMFLGIAFFVSHLGMVGKKRLLVGILFLFYSHPFFDGSLYKVHGTKADGVSSNSLDQRLRLYEFEDDIANIDFELSKQKLYSKSLYMPVGGAIILPENEKFHSLWSSIRDYSVIYTNKIKNPMFNGYTKGIMSTMFQKYNEYGQSNCVSDGGFYDLLMAAGVNNIVLRKGVISTLYSISGEKLQECFSFGPLTKQMETSKYQVYSIDKGYVPLFYIKNNK